MTENILGILFVVSNSRGRTVFRYPPDPLSPSTRLSQPIYPAATYTAPDSRAYPNKRIWIESNSAHDVRFQSSISLRSGSQVGSGSHGAGQSRRLGRPFGEGGSDDGASGFTRTNVRRDEDDDLHGAEVDSDETDESDYDFIWMSQQQGIDSSGGPGGRRDEDQGRRSSLEDVEKEKRPKRFHTHATRLAGGGVSKKKDEIVDEQYNHALNYSLDFLSDMLTPPRSACHRRFELCVEELVFLGHPVCIGPMGKWEFPEEEGDHDRHIGRGRRGRSTQKDNHAHGGSHLRTVVEAGELSSPETKSASSQVNLDDSPDGETSAKDHHHKNEDVDDEDDGPPLLHSFNLVVILDKPDPTLASQLDGHASDPFDEVYKEIVFKWTAAVWDLQVKNNFVARESWDTAKVRDKCLNEGIPIVKCCEMLYQSNALERGLCDLYNAIYHHQTSRVNPLYAHLPSTISVPLDDIKVNMVLSPRSGISEEDWAHWGELDVDSSSESDSEDSTDWIHNMMDPSRKTTTDLRVEPWQTLLLLDERAADNAAELARALVGNGENTTSISVTTSPIVNGFHQESRRESKETTAEEDESALVKALIEACDVTKPLAELAHILRFDLEGIIIPLARELVQNKKAILIDVVNLRLRTLVLPTTIVEHDSTLADYAGKFARVFPDFPQLPSLISRISASPRPFRDIMPGLSAIVDPIQRQPYLDVLLWLLRRDLVVQVHTRARIFASPLVKEMAWRRLWHRRRERWIASIAQNSRKTSTGSSSLGVPMFSSIVLGSPLTPKATISIDPLDATVLPPHGASSPGLSSQTPLTTSGGIRSIEQSFLDYDPDLEMDSDLGEGEGGISSLSDMVFSLEQDEPTAADIPNFTGSFIFKPARAQKDEARWLRVIREGPGEIEASKFDLCVQYFDGIATFEEISYRTGLPKRELDSLTKKYEESIITFLHP